MEAIFSAIDDIMYYPILIIVLAAAGLYFTIRTRFVQIRLLGTACKLIMEKPKGKQNVSSFQALMVSTHPVWEQVILSAFRLRYAWEVREPASGCG